MTADHLIGIEQFEADLWKVADNLRANSNLASNEYFMPILGLIFLRHATNRYYAAMSAIEEDKAAGKMPDRPLVEADFTRRRALMLPQPACYDVLLEMPKDGNLGAAVTTAMETVENHFPPLAGQLPKDYERFVDDVLEEMMRTFDSEALRTASGDVFGRIYEYFLARSYSKGASASRLLSVVRENGLLPDYLDTSFDQFAATLKSGLPKVRGEEGAHGQGAEPRKTPDHVAAYALHLAAAQILFLVEAYQAMK